MKNSKNKEHLVIDKEIHKQLKKIALDKEITIVELSE